MFDQKLHGDSTKLAGCGLLVLQMGIWKFFLLVKVSFRFTGSILDSYPK